MTRPSLLAFHESARFAPNIPKAARAFVESSVLRMLGYARRSIVLKLRKGSTSRHLSTGTLGSSLFSRPLAMKGYGVADAG